MYKGLGFEPIMDKGGRMLVRELLYAHVLRPNVILIVPTGAESGDVHCVTFDDRRKSDAEYANELWKLASS